VTETTDDVAPPSEAEEPEQPTSAEDDESVSELIEQLGRDTSTLIFREALLSATDHAPELRRAARDLAAALVAAVALVTAFALANWAVVNALSPSLSGWRAPLVVAAFWAVLGTVLLLVVLARLGHLAGLKWWRAVGSDREELQEQLSESREEAEEAVRATLDRLSGAVAREAGAQIASAVVPLAGGVAEVGDNLLEAGDEIMDALEDEMPAGGAVGQVVDLVLLPGRFGIRVATTVLKAGKNSG
jgi:MFS family permease